MEKVRPWCGQPLGQRTAKEQNRILSSVTLETPPPPLPPEELSFTNSQILERRWGYPSCSSLKKNYFMLRSLHTQQYMQFGTAYADQGV